MKLMGFLISSALLVGLCAGFFLHTPEMARSLPSEQEQTGSAESSKLDEWKRDTIAIAITSGAKERIFQEVVAGRCTLVEAAMFFRVLEEANPTFNKRIFDYALPGKSIEEQFCREVISWVKAREDAEQLHETRERLEAELDRLVADPKGK